MPGRTEARTLFIGTSQFADNCPAFRLNTNQVDMVNGDATIPTSEATSQQIRVHGFSVLASKTETGTIRVCSPAVLIEWPHSRLLRTTRMTLLLHGSLDTRAAPSTAPAAAVNTVKMRAVSVTGRAESSVARPSI
jgi:hypothetical protein